MPDDASNSEQELAPETAKSTGVGSPDKDKRNKKLHIREKIRAAVILERIERHALGELNPPMNASQLKAAEIALKKCIPDLQAITLTGDDDNPVRLIHTIERRIVGSDN